MEALSFEEWWSDFLENPSFEKDPERAVSRLRGYTAIVHAFTSRADGLRVVRTELEKSDHAAWERLRDALLDEASASWLLRRSE